MAGEGQMLQDAREEKKWSVRDAEDITKISVRYIHALEAENYEILPGTTYVKGYLRTYAKQLGLNPDEIIALYNATAEPEPEHAYEVPVPVVKNRPQWARPLLMVGIAVLTVMLIIVVATSLNRAENKGLDANDSLSTLPTAPDTEEVEPPPDSTILSGQENTEPPTDPTNAPTEPPVTDTAPDVSASAAGTDASASTSTPPEGLTAQLAFSQDCWMQIRIDEQPEFQELFFAGTTREIKGNSRIEFISIGNAGALAVTLNGKVLPSFADGGRVVNNIVLSQDTLQN